MAEIWNDEGELDESMHLLDGSVEDFVMEKVDEWREDYVTNYEEKHDEYYRLWRGIWASEDKTRNSERSRIIAPALQEAVESSVADIEEATFSTGSFFRIDDDFQDENPEDMEFAEKFLKQEFKLNGIRKDIGDCILNSAIYGEGIAEIVVEEDIRYSVGTEDLMEGAMTAVGRNDTEGVKVCLRPISPRNFLCDPSAANIKEALGVAIDEFVPLHLVEQLQEDGVYRKCSLGDTPPETDLEENKELGAFPQSGRIRITKYFGLVPTHLLQQLKDDAEDGDEEYEDLLVPVLDEEDEDSDTPYYTESIIVIADGGKLLKAEANPFMMKDRPIVCFAWDTIPGSIRGRGVCEKGYNSQKALDAELRARIDALALTIHPMIAADARRLPKGANLAVRPGKTLLTQGDPREILQPFNFGSVDQITFAQAGELTKMVQTSTGAVSSTGVGGQINGDATAAGISMSLGAIIKRQKRTLVNFQENFLIPFVQKAVWRYIQYSPESFPVKDYKFVAVSSLGIMAREYEVSQLVQLLQTTSPESPAYGTLIKSVVENMNIGNREEIVAQLKKAEEPTPEAQQAEQAAQELQKRTQEAQIAVLEGQANEFNSRASKLQEETRLLPQELEIDAAKAAATSSETAEEFNQRLSIIREERADKKLALQEERADKKLSLQEKQATMNALVQENQMKRQ